MIRVRLAELLTERKSSVLAFSRATGVSYPRAQALVHGTAKGVSFDVLERICRWSGRPLREVIERDARAPKSLDGRASKRRHPSHRPPPTVHDVPVTREARDLAHRMR